MKKVLLTIFLSASALFLSISVNAADTLKTSSGIKYVRLKEGDGKHPTAGQTVKVFYSRMSKPGKVVETNEGDAPFKFKIGNQEVIPGWDEIVQQMSKGEKIYCVIPPELGYGKRGVEGVVPPNATLYFLIEIVNVK